MLKTAIHENGKTWISDLVLKYPLYPLPPPPHIWAKHLRFIEHYMAEKGPCNNIHVYVVANLLWCYGWAVFW